MSANHVQFIISCHGDGDEVGYRVLAQDGKMYLKTKQQVSVMINGDNAINEFEPNEIHDNLRPEPSSETDGPKKNDIIRVLIQGSFCVCTVLTSSTHRGRPRYKVEYDDGMIVEDYLSVPWNYISVAPTSAPSASDAPSAPSALDALSLVANAIDTNSTIPPVPSASEPMDAIQTQQFSSKALGKRRVNDIPESGAEPSAKALGKRRMGPGNSLEPLPPLHLGDAPASAPAVRAGPDVIAAYDTIEMIAGINYAMSRESKYMTCLSMIATVE